MKNKDQKLHSVNMYMVLFIVSFSFAVLMKDMLVHPHLQDEWTFSKRIFSLYLFAEGY